jgi:predicted nucleic acid-binding protein
MLPKNIPEVFLDTDVAFDLISKREPHIHHSIRLLEQAAINKIQLVLSESSLATLLYLTFDIYKIPQGTQKLADLIQASSIVHAGKSTCLQALHSTFSDKEDALQYFSALHAEADYFITRNLKHYKRYAVDQLPVFTPLEFSDFYDKN